VTFPRDAFEPGYTGNENDPGPRHLPGVRHLRVGWRTDAHGQWVADAIDESQWEVVCVQCGDDDGPADRLLPDVRTLRGPYPSRHRAEHAARRHEREMSPAVRWVPGSAVPPPTW